MEYTNIANHLTQLLAMTSYTADEFIILHEIAGDIFLSI